ncbi:response regulator transcription factor [Salinimonas chungwhensis]|uniref:response regulator transcription factor n=1 Tax=Salinimonas chungwhensis TaxID=265425 RepID=UPI00036BC90F|nr:response regulator [Salinimonas chungwhensis]
MPAPMKVYLVDDDKLILETLTRIFQTNGFSVLSFSDTRTFLHHDIDTDHACVVLDLNMPYHSGLDILATLKHSYPGFPVLIYSGKADVISAVRAMEDGAVTLIQKPAPAELLLSKVKTAIEQRKSVMLDMAKARHAKNLMSQLTERENAVALQVAEGYSASEIAEQLHISNRTVEAHKSNIFSKLNVHSVAGLTRIVLQSER